AGIPGHGNFSIFFPSVSITYGPRRLSGRGSPPYTLGERKLMTILTSTLADVTAAKLTSYYAKPLEGVPIVQPSTDPTVYVQDPNYIKNLNKQAYQKYAVDVPNQYEADRFNFRAKQWE